MIPKGRGKIFSETKIQNKEIIFNIYVYLSLQAKVPMNIIADNLGFSSFNKFKEKYSYLFPKSCDTDIILENKLLD